MTTKKYITVTEEIKEDVINLYQKVWSVSEVRRQLPEDKCVSREKIEKILKDAGLYEGLTGANYTAKNQERIQESVKAKFGVRNYGMVSGGWAMTNKIPYKKIKAIDEDFAKYKKEVEILTKKNSRKVQKPEFCEYTGIKFIDAIETSVNPNDPRKRTIDHKIPIITCYLNGVTVEEASSVTNLAFVLRYVNTIKSNSTYDSFIPLSKKLRKLFINENCPHN
jgi:hypothetical protein